MSDRPRPIDFVPTARGTFATLARGPLEGPVVLCLHGFPDAAGTFDALLDALADAGFRAVAPWMRGYAPSVIAGPYDPDALALDVIALADALSPNAPVAVVGHDWGAVATYAALSLRPPRFARAVTLAVPHPAAFAESLVRSASQRRRSWYMGAFQLPFAGAIVARNLRPLVERLWRDWSPGFTAPRAHLDDVVRAIEGGMPAPIAYYRAMVRPLVPALARLRRAASSERKIRVPTLLLVGENDGCIAPSSGDGQARFFAGDFRAEVLPSVGHFLHLEAPAEVAQRVVAFLAPGAGSR